MYYAYLCNARLLHWYVSPSRGRILIILFIRISLAPIRFEELQFIPPYLIYILSYLTYIPEFDLYGWNNGSILG